MIHSSSPNTWQGIRLNTSYISGACTHPDSRSKGLMKHLLAEAFLRMKQRKTAFSILIPQEDWLYNYYSQSGYATSLYDTPENYYLQVYSAHPAVQALTPEECNRQITPLYAYFQEEMLKRPNCVQHTLKDFKTILQDLYMSEGKLLVYFSASGQIQGMAFALPLSDKIRINELLAGPEDEKSALLQTAATLWNKGEIECKIPPRPGNMQKRGMLRIIDAKQVLDVYAALHPHKSLLLQLTDEQLPSNNGYYRIRNGKVFRTGAGIHKPNLQLRIRELAELIVETPIFISLMLD